MKTHNDKEIEVEGTFGVGSITAEYKDLKRVFGKPLSGDGHKTDAEWEIEFEDGKIATIYNWKNGKTYKGKKGTPKTKITDWSIGGYSKAVVERIENLLK